MKTRIRAVLDSMPLSVKAAALLAAFLLVVVGVVEVVAEPLTQLAIQSAGGEFGHQQEAATWALWIALPSIAGGIALSRILTRKLVSFARASRAIARGNLGVRLPETSNDRDAFDVLARSFNGMADTIEAQRLSERRLLGDISHELRSPLTRISVAADILARRSGRADGRKDGTAGGEGGEVTEAGGAVEVTGSGSAVEVTEGKGSRERTQGKDAGEAADAGRAVEVPEGKGTGELAEGKVSGEAAEDREWMREIADRIAREVARMNETISLLLEQSRAGALSPGGNGTVDIGAMLRLLSEDFAFQGEATGRRVAADIGERLQVYGNAPGLERMMVNVIANAMFYGPEGGEVRIAASLNDGHVTVGVRDFGPGVPEGELEDIFRAFYRVDGSRSRESGGAGLGLALAREAAIQHGGNIAAENALPGLRVTVTLPAGEDGDE